MEKALKEPDIYMIVIGIIMGASARIATLKVDYRQIPTYPCAYFNSIVMGFIASSLGAIAIPAILSGDFVSITFLTVAVQQFRETRKAEGESLSRLEHTEYTKRGDAYIDGISKTFESRNYIAMVTALLSVLAMKLSDSKAPAVLIPCGVITGAVVLILLYRFTKGKTIGDICNIRDGEIEIKGSELFVDGIFVTNTLGADKSRELFAKDGLAVVIEPKRPASRLTLENYGQRQAILFEAVKALGVRRYKYTRRNFSSDTGMIIIAFVPMIHDKNLLHYAVAHTPVLENSRKIGRIVKGG
ncbi:YIEGIA protein [Caprobacter fermentans]|uniref:YIEGIA protein n=1 Tax=Caproicibacter fermentans TaxID=2576756 RepID=A0A6N8I4G1_9FIRM|nr:YIEGIA domain-containing protein [Caproicibacter fermentans]MVB12490.1 YIEGIA protein [Caproicibacter fermentans]OCN03092.1 YIEGIA protein [Clostridium sp. W14A]